jgi:hypothetical protein
MINKKMVPDIRYKIERRSIINKKYGFFIKRGKSPN